MSALYPEKVRELLDLLAEYYNTSVPVRYPRRDPRLDPDVHGDVWGPYIDNEAEFLTGMQIEFVHDDVWGPYIDDEAEYLTGSQIERRRRGTRH